ncbi:MAG: hypothetical protein KDA79_20615, partial [Planctomycetaceae bacterium]|nr:hypothetical protein [Planctomycetaceae bacterium]
LDGIFSKPVPLTDLLDPARRGRLAEDLPTFGTRMQLLIDSQPVLHPERHSGTLRQVLKWYCEDEAAAGFFPPWHYLLNDLLRYHRALAIRYQWSWRDDLSRWRLLKVKEAHSRLLNIAGLLLLLGRFSSQLAESPVAADQAGNALDSLEDRLRLTPLERVTGTLAGTAPSRAARVLAAAGQLSGWLADPAWVKELTAGSGPELAASPLLDTARTAGRQIRAEVAGFLRDQQGSWPEEFLDAVML